MEDRLELIGMFEEMAVLCELAGENPFKARAFDKAARTLQALDLPLGQVLAEPPAGFGKGLLDKIREFLQTERLSELDELRSRFPATLFDLLKVQGLGPKKVKQLYETLQIADLDSLEKACHAHQIKELKGFGAKTEEKILAGIEAVKRFRGQFRRFEVEPIAAAMVTALTRKFPGMPCEVAGSFRRRKEIVRDLDLLAASDAPIPVMKAFVGLPGIRQVLQEGETKSAVILDNGLQVDLRVVPPESYGPALCHFTGSKEHNIRMRQIAQARGLKLNEYGVFRGEVTEPMTTEGEVFEALGLPFIEPELREDLGEIEWAQQRRLPRLITRSNLRGTLHAHTTASDGTATLAGMADAAAERGLQWLGISDHSRSSGYVNGLSIERVEEQWHQIDELNRRRSDIRLLRGIECDLLTDGSLDYPPEVLAKFDFIVVSAHSHFALSRDEMTSRFLKAVANPFTDILGHPTGRILLERDEYAIDLDAVLQACIKHRVIIEINANPYRLDLDWRKVRQYRDSGLMFCITPDAHNPEGLDDLRFGVDVARKGGLEAAHLINTLTAEQLLQFIQSRRHP